MTKNKKNKKLPVIISIIVAGVILAAVFSPKKTAKTALPPLEVKKEISKNRIEISGYIEAAYGLPLNEADTVAQKVCWWNTNHYDDRNYFTKHFNARILESFSDETAVIGLADSYKNWAGHARIVIPFAPEKMRDIQAAAKEGEKQSAKSDAKDKVAKKNGTPDTEKDAAQNKKDGGSAGAMQTGADKNAVDAVQTALQKEALQFKTVPANYKILFGALCLAALLLIVLLVRVVIDMVKN